MPQPIRSGKVAAMPHHSLKTKIVFGTGILFVSLLLLAANTIYTVTHFRRVVFDISRRSEELPAAGRLSSLLSDMRMMISEIKGSRLAEKRVKSRLEGETSREIAKRLELFDFSMPRDFTSYSLFLQKRDEYLAALDYYETLCRERPPHERLNQTTGGDETLSELELIAAIRERWDTLRPTAEDIRWATDEGMIDQIDAQLTELQKITDQLPTELHRELTGFSDAVRDRYRAVRLIAVIISALSALLLLFLLRVSYLWIFRPLRVLVAGSRRVATGDFGYRIRLDSGDEFAELAGALNDMTERFERIRDDLDEQVRKRSEEVIRSERLASVGFLAAGVAHEINNPLASIAISAESLPRRISALADAGLSDEERQTNLDVIKKYVEMIENEAFRCKNITGRLLDYSRMGSGEKTPTDMTALVENMVEMLKTQPRYRNRRIEIIADGPAIAQVNPQEIKQVIVNLITNSFDATPENGLVRVRTEPVGKNVCLMVEDNGAGMEPEMLKKIFEPFFTSKEPGSGTGLGLAIAYRIVTAHHGSIVARSAGKGRGSSFRVELPAAV